VADVEYQVLGLEDANRARRPGSKLALVVKPYNTFPKPASPISPTISTSPTSRSSNFFSRQSTRRSSWSYSERGFGSEEMVCTLEFSDLNDRNLSDSRDKNRFMQHLQQYLRVESTWQRYSKQLKGISMNGPLYMHPVCYIRPSFMQSIGHQTALLMWSSTLTQFSCARGVEG